MQQHEKLIEQWLADTGVRINGPDPWDIRVRDDRFYARVLKDGSLGLGEAYMAGWWDCPRIDEFICRLLKGNLEDKIRGNLRTLLRYASTRLSGTETFPFIPETGSRYTKSFLLLWTHCGNSDLRPFWTAKSLSWMIRGVLISRCCKITKNPEAAICSTTSMSLT